MENGNQEQERAWKELTGFCAEVAEEMVVGQIIKADTFNLYEAMSAVELLDPKMDASCGANKVLSFEEARSRGLLLAASALSLEQIVGLLDHLMMLELMWLEGFPMAQSVYSCLYFHHSTALLDDSYFSPYMRSLRARCGLVHAIVNEADVAEDEDFPANLNGAFLPIPSANHVDDIVSELQKAENTLLQIDGEQKEISSNLAVKLRFGRNFLQLLWITRAKKFSGLSKATTIATTLLEDLCLIGKDKAPRAPPQHSIQPDIGKRVYFSSYPRVVPPLNFEASVTKYQNMVKQFQLLFQQLVASNGALDKLESVILELVNQKANILVRALWTVISLQVSPSSKQVAPEVKILSSRPLSAGIIQMAKDLYDIPEIVFQNESMKKFLSEASKSYTLYLKLLPQNKARRLFHLTELMREWDTLINIGSEYDFELRKNEDFSTFHYGYTIAFEWQLRGMMMYLQLGYDLDLYSSHEMIVVAWYLENLAYQRNRNMQMILQFNLDSKVLALAAERGGGKARKGGKKAGKLGAAPTKKSQEPKPTPFSHEISACYYLQRGIVRLLVGLFLEKKIVIDVDFPFGSPEKRYLTRFKAFYKVQQPQVLFYSAWAENKAAFSKFNFNDAAEFATATFLEARKELDKIIGTEPAPKFSASSAPDLKKTYIQALFKTTVANQVQLGMMLKMNLHKDPLKKVVLNFDALKDFPVIMLK